MYNVDDIRKDFPIFCDTINGKPNVYLDTAASAQKPECVINRMCETYRHTYANVHRGGYFLSEHITFEYEKARENIAHFINARNKSEIIFTRNATESINLVAATWAQTYLKANDEILISEAEHHANLIPWQIIAQKCAAQLKVFKLGDDGSFIWEEFEKALTDKVKLLSVTAMSNVLGTIYPVKQMCAAAHKKGATVLVDACQYAVHEQIDVQNIDCDFLAFSGHKLYGPTGIGILYGKQEILEALPPYQTGGDMVDHVSYHKTTFAEPPARFEAGTPACVQAIGLSEAIDYVKNIGLDHIKKHEEQLIKYFIERSKDSKGFKLISKNINQGGVFAFDFNGIHPQDLAFVLFHEGVAIRVGHHCAEPFVNRLGYTSLPRVSFGLYTNFKDIDTFFEILEKARRFF